jgi:hypothetical protein
MNYCRQLPASSCQLPAYYDVDRDARATDAALERAGAAENGWNRAKQDAHIEPE